MTEQQDERRRQILEAAERVFLRRTIAGARMEEIAREAGLSVGGLYWHYKGKQELFLDFVRSLFEPDLQELHSLARLPGSTEQRLERCLMRTVAEDRRIRPLIQEMYSLAQRDDGLQTQLRSYCAAYRDLFAEILTAGVVAGEIRAIDVQSAAVSLLSLYEGAMELSLLAMDSEDPSSLVVKGLAFLFNGILAQDRPQGEG